MNSDNYGTLLAIIANTDKKTMGLDHCTTAVYGDHLHWTYPLLDGEVDI
jgi:hypothetical protein